MRWPRGWRRMGRGCSAFERKTPKSPRVVKGPQPLKLISALTTCASKRMKTRGFRTLRVLPPGSVCERQNPKKLEEMARSHFLRKRMLDKRRPYVLLSQQIIYPGRANGPCKRERRALMINTAITMYGMMMCCSMSLGHGERLRCLQ